MTSWPRLRGAFPMLIRSHRVGHALAIAAIVVLAGCGEGTDPQDPPSNDHSSRHSTPSEPDALGSCLGASGPITELPSKASVNGTASLAKTADVGADVPKPPPDPASEPVMVGRVPLPKACDNPKIRVGGPNSP